MTDDDDVDLGARTNCSPSTTSLVAALHTGGACDTTYTVTGSVLTSTPPSISSGEHEIRGSAIPSPSKSSNNDAVSNGYPNKQLEKAPPEVASTEPTAQASISTRSHRSSAKSRSTSTSAGASVPARTTRSTANANANATGNIATRPRRSMRQEELGGNRTKRARV